MPSHRPNAAPDEPSEAAPGGAMAAATPAGSPRPARRHPGAAPSGETRPRAVPPLRSALAHWLPTPLLRGSALVHLAALALVAAGRWRWGAAAVVADHALLAAAGLAPRSGLLGPVVTRLPSEAAARGEVALTFDDGPDPAATPAVLDLLEGAGCRASFFLVGRRAARHPRLVVEIAARGHAVENHTFRHAHGFAFLGPRRMAAEIDRAQATLAALAGRPPAWFRPVAGMRNPWMGPLVAARGLAIASWTRRGFDTVVADPARVARRLTADLAAGDVLLLHDGSAARGAGGRPVAVAALPAVLAALAERGLRGVPLPRTEEAGAAVASARTR